MFQKRMFTLFCRVTYVTATVNKFVTCHHLIIDENVVTLNKHARWGATSRALDGFFYIFSLRAIDKLLYLGFGKVTT